MAIRSTIDAFITTSRSEPCAPSKEETARLIKDQWQQQAAQATTNLLKVAEFEGEWKNHEAFQ